jgi:hypothetical protein
MRKVLYGVLTLITIGFLIVAGWTGGIYREINSHHGQFATDTFQYVDDDPIEGNVTLHSPNEMYEGVPISVFFNISLEVQGHVPMYLEIRRIEFLFTPIDLENRTEADLPKEVGRWSAIALQIENASSVNIASTTTITPDIITGDVFLGCSVDYLIRNDSLSGPCEYGNDCWFGPDGSLFMIPVNVYPLILEPSSWSVGLAGSLLVWVLIVINEFRRRAKNGSDV